MKYYIYKKKEVSSAKRSTKKETYYRRCINFPRYSSVIFS